MCCVVLRLGCAGEDETDRHRHARQQLPHRNEPVGRRYCKPGCLYVDLSAGFNDRHVVQEIIKEIAQTHTVNVGGESKEKEKEKEAKDGKDSKESSERAHSHKHSFKGRSCVYQVLVADDGVVQWLC